MKNKILRNLVITMSVASIILVVIINYIYVVLDNSNISDRADNALKALETSIDNRSKEADKLILQFGDDNIAKAKALELILDQKDVKNMSVEDLEEIGVALNSEEITITDKNGDIINSTGAYNNYNIKDKEEFKDFTSGLGTDGFSKVKNVMSYENVVQYVAISRGKDEGLLIIKCDTRYVSKSIYYAGISNLVSDNIFMNDSNICVIDKNEWTYKSNTETNKLWQTSQFPKKNFKADTKKMKSTSLTVGGKSCRLFYKYHNNDLIVISVPVRVIYSRREYVCGTVTIMCIVLVLISYLTVRSKLIRMNTH